jgi:hypothetical protein
MEFPATPKNHIDQFQHNLNKEIIKAFLNPRTPLGKKLQIIPNSFVLLQLSYNYKFS